MAAGIKTGVQKAQPITPANPYPTTTSHFGFTRKKQPIGFLGVENPARFQVITRGKGKS